MRRLFRLNDFNELSKRILNIKSKDEKGYDSTATVVRIEEGSVFVKIDGGTNETPCKATVSCKVGDRVRVRVAGGRCWIVGNVTSPSTDDSKAIEVEGRFEKILVDDIIGKNGYINLAKGTFNYGNGSLSWDGKKLVLKGIVEAKSGKIGKWDITDDGLEYYSDSSTESLRTISRAYISADFEGAPIIEFSTNEYSTDDSNDYHHEEQILIHDGSLKLAKTEYKNGDGYVHMTVVSSDFGFYTEEMYRALGTKMPFVHLYTDTGSEVRFGVGSSGYNRGIYDVNTDRWQIYSTQNNETVVTGSKYCALKCDNDGQSDLKLIFMQIDGFWGFYPNVNGSFRLGNANYRWNSIFSQYAVNTSDIKEKDVIEHDWKIDEFIRGLKPIAYFSKSDGSAGERIHMGFGAQDVSELCKRLKIGDMAVYEASYKEESKGAYHGENVSDEELVWGLKYNEFIAPMVMEMQKLMNRCDELETENSKLESRIERLERMIFDEHNKVQN